MKKSLKKRLNCRKWMGGLFSQAAFDHCSWFFVGMADSLVKVHFQFCEIVLIASSTNIDRRLVFFLVGSKKKKKSFFSFQTNSSRSIGKKTKKKHYILCIVAIYILRKSFHVHLLLIVFVGIAPQRHSFKANEITAFFIFAIIYSYNVRVIKQKENRMTFQDNPMWETDDDHSDGFYYFSAVPGCQAN